MATLADVRRISMALPGVEEGTDRFGFSVLVKGKQKGFVWSWKERIDPKKPRVENLGVMAIRTPSVAARDAMIVNEPRKYFTEPHYAGFPAVLVRLKEVKVADLKPLLAEARLCLTKK